MKKSTKEITEFMGLAERIKRWAVELGFQQAGISNIDLQIAETRFRHWLEKRFHGEMRYLARHGTRRTRPSELVPGTACVISVRINHLPQSQQAAIRTLAQADTAYISRYALGRDYHKLIRRRLQQLADRIAGTVGEFGYRVFCDSAPVLEKPLAQKAGLGWQGKHTNLINRTAGSWFFLGEIFTDLPLPLDAPASDHCGRCRTCLDICPTKAIVAPYELDARRCISYLTIELHGSIPLEYRPLIGNRIYGCDDCLLECPWNRFARLTEESAFLPRQGLDSVRLLALFGWSKQEFFRRMEGSPIRRLGYARWQRNLAVALGNAPADRAVVAALDTGLETVGDMAAEHIVWALEKQYKKLNHKDKKWAR